MPVIATSEMYRSRYGPGVTEPDKTLRGWVNTSSLPDLNKVSRDFRQQYGVEVTAFTVLRSTKGGWTQIDAVVTEPGVASRLLRRPGDKPNGRLRAEE